MDSGLNEAPFLSKVGKFSTFLINLAMVLGGADQLRLASWEPPFLLEIGSVGVGIRELGSGQLLCF